MLGLLFCAARSGLFAAAPLAERFANPPAESRILRIIHSWPDAPNDQDQLIRTLSRQGYGGVVCNVSFNDYLESEPRWQAFVRAVGEAKKAGFALWLYDEKGYPSGNAGGLVLRDHPEWEAHGLLIADLECGEGPVTLDLPPGKPFLVAAFPVKEGVLDLARPTDLAAQVRDRKLAWQAPAGTWHVMAITEDRLFEGTHASGNLWQKIPYVDLLRPEPTARFLELTHRRYAEHLDADLGKLFVSTFTDEPSLMSMFLKPMPYRVLPWAANLPVEFRKRRGYDAAAIVPALIAEAGANGSRARYDFWLTVGELVSANFFGQIQDWCQRHNLRSGGHLLMEENITTHVPLYGDFFRCARRMDAPSIDCLTSVPPEVPWYIARLLAGAAELEGKTVVMSETSDHGQRYRPPGDNRPVRNVTEAEIRGTCNRLMVGGVNTITSYYAFAGLDDNALRRLNEWVGRCGTMLLGGHQVADLALLYPIESLWPRFRPARNWANDSPAATRIETVYRAAAESLFAVQRDFTVVDSRALAEAKVEQAALVHGPLRWRVVVLPGADTLPVAAWRNLARFVENGGVLITLGALPANSETEFPSPQVRALARELFGEPAEGPNCIVNRAGGAGVFLPAGSEGLLPIVLDQALEPGLRFAPRNAAHARQPSPVRVTHRRLEGHEVWFLINDSPKPWTGSVSVGAIGPGERWDPATGRSTPLASPADLPLELDAYGAAFLRFAAARPPARQTLKPGVLPNLVWRELPEAQPHVVRGEFVREDLRAEPASADRPRAGWRVNATLTKGKVDTFLFLRFLYPRPLDLSNADCLELESWVPPRQAAPTQLLVILREKDGGDFLASTGRLLGAPGRERVFVPLHGLQLAGWSKDADGELDLSRVDEVRVGWGGYYGTEGETVEFGMVLPRIGGMAANGATANAR